MTDPIRELPLSIDDQLKGLDLSIMRLVNPPQPLAKDNWEALNSFGGAFGGPAKRCLFDLRDRLAAVEARLAQSQAVANGRPLVLPDECFQAMEAAAARVATATTADELSPVEPAPQAPQGVTVEELANAVVRVFTEKKPGNDMSAAYDITVALWSDPRIGPLLRGEGAPVQSPVVLPEEPPINTTGRSLTELAFMAYRDGRRAAWAEARAMLVRQQGKNYKPFEK